MPHRVGDPLDDPAWRAHLFRTRSEEQLRRWARSLRWFRFCRGRPSPFLTEPDRLLVAIGWDDPGDRRAVLDALGLDGRPGWYDLAGGRVQLEVPPGRLVLAVWGGEQRRNEITDRDVELAGAVEESIESLADRVIDPPVDDRSCIAPARYPAVFAST